jgi:hypothetical protein
VALELRRKAFLQEEDSEAQRAGLEALELRLKAVLEEEDSEAQRAGLVALDLHQKEFQAEALAARKDPLEREVLVQQMVV